MKKRVLKRFVNYVRCELPVEEGSWPEMVEVEAMIICSPHYQALADVGLPKNHGSLTGRQTLEEEVQWYTQQTILSIERRWIDKKIHDCLGIKELEACMLKEIGALKPGYSDALTFIKKYYAKLKASISNTLYYAKPVFDRSALALMVPQIESPFFNREQIINNYLKQSGRCQIDMKKQ